MTLTPLDLLDQGHIVIMPNQRSEQYWSRCWLNQSQKGALAGDRVYALTRFLKKLWGTHQQSFACRLLTPQQSVAFLAGHLWHLRPSTINSSYAAELYNAWQRCARSLLTVSDLRLWPMNGVQEQFAADLEYCLEKKNQQNILFLEELPGLLSRTDILSAIELPERHIFFYGFDDWNPALKAFYETLQSITATCHIVLHQKNELAQKHHAAVLYQSLEEELLAALTWLKEQPLSQRSAVIVPDMRRAFQTIKSQLHQHFESDHRLLPLEQQRSWLAISSGIPLEQHPVITELFAALKGGLSVAPALIEKEKWPQYQHIFSAVALWDAHLTSLLEGLSQLQWLVATGPLSSDEFQASQCFYQLLREMVGANTTLPPMSATDFISALEMIARETLFQPQSFTDKKMVLGLLEAAALPWDALWICQGTTEFFPPPLSLHRLLSAAQQRAQQMPQSCADKEWRYFKALLQRLCDIVPSITVSSNKQSSYSWAPLWKVFHIPEPVESVRANNNQSPSLRRQQFYTPQPAQKTKMTLSVSQFNAFISCPFKGWAMSLKDAAPDKEMHPIFDARIWGQISHLFVQYYLRNQSDSFSKNTIFSSWPTTLQSYALKKWHESAMLLVTKIPQDLISPSVLIEQSFEYQLGPIQLQGRVDLLSKHGRVVDIKTAQPVLSQWFNEKPTQWQAAIYALATQAQYFGLLYFAADSAHYWESDVALWKSSWQEQLQSYALLWQQGQYYPEPQSTSTCRHCVFKTCCRIDLQESRA